MMMYWGKGCGPNWPGRQLPGEYLGQNHGKPEPELPFGSQLKIEFEVENQGTKFKCCQRQFAGQQVQDTNTETETITSTS